MTTARITRENERPLTLCEITNEILSGYSKNIHLPSMIQRERIENYDFNNTTDIVFDPSLVNLSVDIDEQHLYDTFNESRPTAECVTFIDDGWNDIINCDISGVSFTHGSSSDAEEEDDEDDDHDDDYPYYPEDYMTGAEYFERCLYG